MDLLKNKSKDVQAEALAWYQAAKNADWSSFADVRESFSDVDLVGRLLVFNIRQNRFRLIIYPVFSGRRLYIKALLNHAEYERGEWKKQWP